MRIEQPFKAVHGASAVRRMAPISNACSVINPVFFLPATGVFLPATGVFLPATGVFSARHWRFTRLPGSALRYASDMIHLYGRHTSYNVQKVLWLLDEIGLTYHHTNLGGDFAGLDSDAFGKLNPHRLVPVLTDGPTTVWESHAIIRYLAATYSPGNLWPIDPRERAMADQWMEWATNALMPAFGRLFWGYYRTPQALRDEQAIIATRKQLTTLYRALNDQLEGRAYLVGDTLSIADIPAGTSLYRYFEMGLEVERPANVWRWYQSLNARPAYRQRIIDPFDQLYGRLAY